MSEIAAEYIRPLIARTVIAARIFAGLSLVAAILVLSIIYLEFPDIGYEGMLVLAGLSIWACILSGLAVFALSFLNFRNYRDKQWYWPVAVSLLSISLILVVIYVP